MMEISKSNRYNELGVRFRKRTSRGRRILLGIDTVIPFIFVRIKINVRVFKG